MKIFGFDDRLLVFHHHFVFCGWTSQWRQSKRKFQWLWPFDFDFLCDISYLIHSVFSVLCAIVQSKHFDKWTLAVLFVIESEVLLFAAIEDRSWWEDFEFVTTHTAYFVCIFLLIFVDNLFSCESNDNRMAPEAVFVS